MWVFGQIYVKEHASPFKLYNFSLFFRRVEVYTWYFSIHKAAKDQNSVFSKHFHDRNLNWYDTFALRVRISFRPKLVQKACLRNFEGHMFFISGLMKVELVLFITTDPKYWSIWASKKCLLLITIFIGDVGLAYDIAAVTIKSFGFRWVLVVNQHSNPF